VCRQVEENVFPSSAVAGLLGPRFVEARIHTDHDEYKQQWRQLQYDYTAKSGQPSPSNPIYMIVDPANGDVLARMDGYNGFGPAQMLDFLRPFAEG
jgi:hypothetical protein